MTTAASGIASGPEPTFCLARLNYVGGAGTSDEIHSIEVTIRDGRRAQLPAWQSCGFELMPHRSRIAHWDDEAEVARVHYPEIEAIARRLAGCDHALVAGHISRNPEAAARHSDLAPIAFVHSDFADTYGELVRGRYRSPSPEARKALERSGIEADAVVRARRILILQFWRNIGAPRMDMPLAFCDARTVGRDELRSIPVTDYAGGGFDFDALAIVAPDDPDRHHWYAFPEMRDDEVVAFRTYDSELAERGGTFWTPHAAFPDPDVPAGRPGRRSIELRATCIFE